MRKRLRRNSQKQDNSNIQNEADILNAEIAGNNDLVDSLRQQAILKKAGIEPTEKNLKLYKDELDATIKLNKELDAAKNKKTLNDKAKDSEADNAMTKATLNKDYNVVSQLERENVKPHIFYCSYKILNIGLQKRFTACNANTLKHTLSF